MLASTQPCTLLHNVSWLLSKATITFKMETTVGGDDVGDDMESTQPEGIVIDQNHAKRIPPVFLEKHVWGDEALDVTHIRTLGHHYLLRCCGRCR